MKKVIGFLAFLVCVVCFVSQEVTAFGLGSIKKKLETPKMEVPGQGTLEKEGSGGGPAPSYLLLKKFRKAEKDLEDVEDKEQVWQSVKSYFSGNECIEKQKDSQVASGATHHYNLHCGKAFPSEGKCMLLNATCHQEPSRTSCNVEADEEKIIEKADLCPAPFDQLGRR